MNRKIFMILVLFVIACVSGYFVWKTLFAENDQDILERRMTEIAQTMGKTGQEGIVVQLEHARTISKYFDDICDIRLPKFNREAKMSRKDVEQNIMTARNWTTELELKFYELEFYFQEGDPKRCKVLFTGMLKARLKTGGSFDEGYELEMNWIKKNGEWLLEGIGFSEILNK